MSRRGIQICRCLGSCQTRDPRFRRHRLNDRESKDTVVTYADLICEHSVVENHVVLGVPTSNDFMNCIILVVCAATVVESFYYADEHFPDNVNVTLARERGLNGVSLLYLNTPSDAIVFFKIQGNLFNGIAVPTSFM